MPSTTILWYRNDLRVDDQPALEAATRHAGPVVPVFIAPIGEQGPWAPGAASRWWLHHSLASLDLELRSLGSRLVLRRGDPATQLRDLAVVTGAERVVGSTRVEPAERTVEAAVATALGDIGVETHLFNTGLLHEPGAVANAEGLPYRVFTPFWKACLSAGLPPPSSNRPGKIAAPDRWPEGLDLADLRLLPRHDWAEGISQTWRPGREGALAALATFVETALEIYDEGRNRPDLPATSRLSPHLHFGEIGVREVVAACAGRDAGVFLSEIGWREFAHHLLWHFPHTPDAPLRAEFDAFPWSDDEVALEAWQRGRTGFPFVDAAMRELWSTGWMHNRTRMVVASFLVKDLLIPWQRGAEWFWDTLVDADLANNTLGWQWTAGCGADAAPYFRVFNPTAQGEKFDPQGDYVKRWVPELAALPEEWIHRPAEAPPDVLRAARVRLGETYPRPMVDHAAARRGALSAYEAIRGR